MPHSVAVQHITLTVEFSVRELARDLRAAWQNATTFAWRIVGPFAHELEPAPNLCTKPVPAPTIPITFVHCAVIERHDTKTVRLAVVD